MPETITAHSRYEYLQRARQPYLDRAREGAEVTLPYLFPPEGSGGETNLPTPFQSVGARGVNTLAAKLLLALFPPNTPFFELAVDDFAVSELEEESGQEDIRGEINNALASVTRAVVERFDGTRPRNKIFDLLKNLIVGGNALLEILEDDTILVHKLPAFVVKRDGQGLPVDIILKKTLSRRTAPQNLLDLLPDSPEDGQVNESDEQSIPLYTWVRRNAEDKMWEVHQEVGESSIRVPDSEGTYPLDKAAWVPLRFISVEGEDYGRAYTEEYLGDLISLERGTRAIIDFAAAASKIIPMIDPGGTTDIDEFVEARSGDAIEGTARDITTYQLEKFADFQIADAVVQRMEDRLEKAFLLASGVPRNAERVTAEEIRLLASELEESLGGVYSLLAGELQEPLVTRLMAQMTKRKDIPKLPDDTVQMKIVTGVAAIGRNHDLIKIDTFIRGMLDVADERALDYIKFGPLWKRRAAAINLPIEDIVRSDEEVSEIQQKRQAMQAAVSAAPQAVKAGADAAAQSQQQPQE